MQENHRLTTAELAQTIVDTLRTRGPMPKAALQHAVGVKRYEQFSRALAYARYRLPDTQVIAYDHETKLYGYPTDLNAALDYVVAFRGRDVVTRAAHVAELAAESLAQYGYDPDMADLASECRGFVRGAEAPVESARAKRVARQYAQRMPLDAPARVDAP